MTEEVWRYLYVLLVYEKKELKEFDRHGTFDCSFVKKRIERRSWTVQWSDRLYLNERSVNGQRNECKVKETELF